MKDYLFFSYFLSSFTFVRPFFYCFFFKSTKSHLILFQIYHLSNLEIIIFVYFLFPSFSPS